VILSPSLYLITFWQSLVSFSLKTPTLILHRALSGSAPDFNAAENSRRAPQNGRQPAAAARNF
jgi:hypothetical protein